MKKFYFNDAKAWEVWGCDSIQDIADLIYLRIDEDEVNDSNDLYDAIIDALNDEVIYYNQQWTILEFYCLPQDANWNDAIELFIDDLLQAIVMKEEFKED